MPNIPQDLYDALLTTELFQDYNRNKLLAKIDLWQMPVATEKKPVANNLFAMFDRASKNLKYPKITFPAYGLNQRAKIQLSLASNKSAHPGCINITDSGSYGNNIWYGRIFKDRIEYSRSAGKEIKAFINKLIADPTGAAKISGQQFGHCCFCAKEITNPNSLTVGYGPICAENYGLPWEGTAEAMKAAREEEEAKQHDQEEC